jgi:hypothetical protein
VWEIFSVPPDNYKRKAVEALKMPQQCSEVDGFAPDADEYPFLCLLEDDRLITEFKVTTDRLLTPLGDGDITDVQLIIHVKALVVKNSADTWAMFNYDK